MNHRKGKREARRLQRFLSMRVRWSPWFAQELQGMRLMRGVFAAAERRKG